MIESLLSYQVGDLRITRISEMSLQGGSPQELFNQNFDAEQFAAYRDKSTEHDLQADGEHLIQSIHSWLVQSPEYTLLIDAGSGNEKQRPNAPIFHQLNTDFLTRLANLGLTPESIDYVLLTHLHVDHVGWNTQRVDGKWLPTFPNATYLFSAIEARYYASSASHNEVNRTSLGVYEDSIFPLIEAGVAKLIGKEGGEVLNGVRFIPTPGHSIDHMSISIESGGDVAFFAGDLMHHPLQVYNTEWNTRYCEFPAQASASRRWGLEYAADSGALWFSTHFAGTSVGRVYREDEQFSWQYR